jgi:hypothetical protein
MNINGKNPLFSSKPIGFHDSSIGRLAIYALSHDGITFATESNKTQTRIASEIKASGEESSRIGRDSLKVTRWVFYATIAVFILTVAWLVLSELDRRNGSSDSEFFRQRAEQFTTGLTDLSKAMAADRDAASADFKAALTQIEQNRATQDKQVSTILDGQAELIRQQADQRLQDQQTIEDLRRKISELEAKFEGREPQTQPVEGGE